MLSGFDFPVPLTAGRQDYVLHGKRVDEMTREEAITAVKHLLDQRDRDAGVR